MQKPMGFIALLLVIAIIISPGNSPENGYVTESPQTVCGDSIYQSETQEDNESGNIIAFIVFVLIVIFVVYCITGSDNQSHEWR